MCFIYFGVKKGNGEGRREKKEERREKEEEGRSASYIYYIVVHQNFIDQGRK
jgi:hypothetical protein